MYLAYYLETNIISIVIMLLIFLQIRRRTSKFESSIIIFQLMIIIEIILCFSDILAAFFRGKFFTGARTAIEISNILYFISSSFISFLWLIYVNLRINKTSILKTKNLLLAGFPFIIFIVMCLANPMTNFIFKINDQNLYERQFGTIFHIIISWGYVLVPTFQVLVYLITNKSKVLKRNQFPLLLFIIPPSIASAFQISNYGITLLQCGIMISLLLIYLEMQQGLILKDELTGINNKRAFNNQVENLLQHNSSDEITVVMMDVNHFKGINDTFGHLEGDNALKQTAETIQQTVQITNNKFRAYRYGGDEFVLLGVNSKPEDIEEFKTTSNNLLKEKSSNLSLNYMLNLSIGFATKKCTNYEDFEELIRLADEEMYKDKNKEY